VTPPSTASSRSMDVSTSGSRTPGYRRCIASWTSRPPISCATSK
jgi:hypothetical protein